MRARHKNLREIVVGRERKMLRASDSCAEISIAVQHFVRGTRTLSVKISVRHAEARTRFPCVRIQTIPDNGRACVSTTMRR